MLGLLSLIPGLMSLIQFVVGKAFDAKVSLVQARTGADRDVATAIVKAAAVAEHETTSKFAIFASNPLLVFLLIGFASPLVLYCWKIIVVDIIIGPGCVPFTKLCWVGNTDPIRGQVGDWATTIISCLFGSSTVLAAGKMYFGRDKSGE